MLKEYGKRIAGQLRKDIRGYGLVCILIMVYVAVLSVLFGTPCPIRLVTGLPCPGCGITRAAVLFVTGHWQQAWQMNPVIFPIVLVVLYYGVNRYLLGREAKEIKGIVIGIAIMLLAVYLLRIGCYFPDREPYGYLRGNLLERTIPSYRENLLNAFENAKRISQS